MSNLQLPNLPGYILTDKLGAGSYATVYKAYKTTGKRDVSAVKCILKSSLNNISKENLLTEIKILKELKHKHIVEMKDFQWDDKYVYILLEYCSGGDLRYYLDLRQNIKERTAQKFFQQLAKALGFLHQNNVLHLDLKPSNILLTSSTNPILKLADFGFAMSLNKLEEDKSLRGSLLYMAPEVYQKKEYNEKADLWSTGVILYECLYGHAPFTSDNLDDLKNKINSQASIILPTHPRISAECSDVLACLLQRQTQLRINMQHFITHPFVAMEIVSLQETIDNANELMAKGMRKEKNGDLEDAIDNYCNAVRLMILAADEETDDVKKSLLKEKAVKLVERAEELKSRLKPTREMTTANNEGDSYQLLNDLADGNLLLAEAVGFIEAAYSSEDGNDYEKALINYQSAIAILLEQIKNDIQGTNKKIFQEQASKLLGRAEQIKKYLTITSKLQINCQKDDNQSSCLIQ